MKSYFVTKTVEYFYTIEAESSEQAEKLANDYGTIEASQWTVMDIVAENFDEYESSIEGV